MPGRGAEGKQGAVASESHSGSDIVRCVNFIWEPVVALSIKSPLCLRERVRGRQREKGESDLELLLRRHVGGEDRPVQSDVVAIVSELWGGICIESLGEADWGRHRETLILGLLLLHIAFFFWAVLLWAAFLLLVLFVDLLALIVQQPVCLIGWHPCGDDLERKRERGR
jgi:hypothetical protein